MTKIRRLIISSAAILLFSSVALAVPVSARDGSSVEEPAGSVLGTPPSTSEGTSDSGLSSSGSSLADQFREMAKQKVEQAKQNHQEQTEVQREKVCGTRKANLTKRMATAVTVAERHKTNIDRIYAKVKDFYTTKQLNVSNYTDLTAKVDAAQTNAQVAIDALKALDVNVDCTSQTVANSVSAFQQAVSNTRDSLKAYRSALVDLITALKGASTSSNTSSSTDNTSTGQ
jgi:hypothetical protein